MMLIFIGDACLGRSWDGMRSECNARISKILRIEY